METGRIVAEETASESPKDLSSALASAAQGARRHFPGEIREAWKVMIDAMPANGLGRACQLSYLHGSTACAQALGPEAAIRLGEAGMVIARGAGEQAALELFAQAPKAARILGAGEPFWSWLHVLEALAPQIPESMIALLQRMEGLLERLDAHALEAWALGGIRSAGGDPASRLRYFNFADPRAEQWLQREAGEAELSWVEGRLKIYLMALWRMRCSIRRVVQPKGAPAPRRASFDSGLIRMPESFQSIAGQHAELVYRAAAAHIAAHFVFGEEGRFPKGALKPLQIVLVSLIEDARVEQLAMRVFPGLAALWRPFHIARASGAVTASSLMARLAHALIDPGYEDDNAWVSKGRALFYAERDHWEDASISRRIGGLLGNDLGQMRIQLNARTFVVEPAYRDDNQGLWRFDDPAEQQSMQMETITESVRIDRQLKDARPTDSATKVEVLTEREGLPVAQYPEWDYEISRDRPEWTTILDFPGRAGSLNVIERVLTSHALLVNRIAVLIHSARISRPKRLRRQPEGDRLDIDACIEAAVSIRRREIPDPRVHITETRRHRDLAVSLLLDVSESSRDRVKGAYRSVLSLERDAAILLAHAMAEQGDPFAIRAFCSNGREEVRYLRIKDFEEPYGDGAKRRLAGLEAGFSTRIGAALRHAGAELSAQLNHRRLLLVITDGEPSDIDVTDRKYLVEDARKTVASLSHLGVDVFCVGLDSGGDSYLHRIFGHRNVLLIDRLERLPEQLTTLYFRLMK